MNELNAVHCADIGGGFAPVAGMAFAVSLIGNSGAIYDFFSGFFDGLNNVR